MENKATITAALDVMRAHIEALNSRDEPAIAETLHFPHYRLADTILRVWNTQENYFSDFRARAGSNWKHSSIDDIKVVQASDTKVHLDVEIRRYNASGALITNFRSLWVITFENGKWAAKFRSSFASQ